MKKLLAILFIPLMLCAAEKPPTVKVLIKKQIDGAVVEVKGAYKVYNPLTGKQISSGMSGKRYIMEPVADGLMWGERFPGVYQMQIFPNSNESTLLVDGIEYRGTLEVYQIDGSLQIVNEVPIECYIKSILTHEFTTCDLERATLESLAIIARTNAYHLALQKNTRFFHIDASNGSYMGYAATLLNLNIDHAVDATSSMVLLYRGEPFPCTWTANCAGKTASYASIFRKKVTTPAGVSVPLAQKDRNHTAWKFSMSKEALAKLAKVNHITEVALYLDESSNRTYAVKVKDGKHSRDIAYTALKRAIGNKLRSSDFSVYLDRGEVIFEGYGDGDGTGLCLFTTQLLAKKGDEAPDILADFFPSTHLQKKESLIDYPKLELEIPDGQTVN